MLSARNSIVAFYNLINTRKKVSSNMKVLSSLVGKGWMSFDLSSGWEVSFVVAEQDTPLTLGNSFSVLYYLYNKDSGERLGQYIATLTNEEIPSKLTLRDELDVINLVHYLSLNIGDASKFKLGNSYIDPTNQKLI